MPKSSTFTVPSSANHDVLGLDVAVDDAALVRRAEGARDVAEPENPPLHGDALVADVRAKRAALDELHGDVRRAFDLANVVDRDGVRVRERGGGPRLAKESGATLRAGRRRAARAFDAHDFERDAPVESAVVSAEDAAHAALAENALNRIALGEDAAYLDGHCAPRIHRAGGSSRAPPVVSRE